ncbi:hypothetical protein Taro_051516 [Colocasia esculenta]|uniref:Uncharacterized protein n=1 Tax=Colocasia esculenta TaxID=4460 RepID=A0A843XGZ9_COLES|nr:hypothetical protein [Colocasia esculenta]
MSITVRELEASLRAIRIWMRELKASLRAVRIWIWILVDLADLDDLAERSLLFLRCVLDPDPFVALRRRAHTREYDCQFLEDCFFCYFLRWGDATEATLAGLLVEVAEVAISVVPVVEAVVVVMVVVAVAPPFPIAA